MSEARGDLEGDIPAQLQCWEGAPNPAGSEGLRLQAPGVCGSHRPRPPPLL